MERILRADGRWAEAIADALRRAPRPIGLDERLLPRLTDGETTRQRADRSAHPPARQAATLLAIYPDAAGELVVPLTVRRTELRAHAGEISLPGGAVDAADADHRTAALREAEEEIGLRPDAVQVLGRLDEVWIPVSNYELQPFVGAVVERPTLVPHDGEVAAIVELPLRLLFDPTAVTTETLQVRGLTITAGAFRLGELVVWGATALTLGMLARVLAQATETP